MSDTPMNEKTLSSQPKLSYFSLYRHATPQDIVFIILGTLCAILNGATLPYMTVVFGKIQLMIIFHLNI